MMFEPRIGGKWMPKYLNGILVSFQFATYFLMIMNSKTVAGMASSFMLGMFALKTIDLSRHWISAAFTTSGSPALVCAGTENVSPYFQASLPTAKIASPSTEHHYPTWTFLGWRQKCECFGTIQIWTRPSWHHHCSHQWSWRVAAL